MVNLAVVDANTMSALAIWTNPMPAQAPLIAAMIGLGISRAVVIGQRRYAPPASPVRGRLVEHLHVEAGAERLAGAGDHDRPHRRVVGGGDEGAEVGVLERERPAVVAVRPVQREQQHAVLVELAEQLVELRVVADRCAGMAADGGLGTII